MMKLLFVVNPVSGGVDKDPFLKEARSLCQKYNIELKILKTTGKNDHEKLKSTLQKYQPDKIAAVGGDGTLLFTALGIMETDYPVGIIPLGSANGMAKELEVNPKPIEALKELILSQKIVGMDILKVNDQHYSLHVGDVGINAQIVDAYDNDPKRGLATYAKYFLSKLTQMKHFPVNIHANGKKYTNKVLMLGICNSRKYGTGVPLNLSGNPMDGKFELVMVTHINANSIVKIGLSIFNESFYDNQSSEVITTDCAEIEFDKARLLQLDGEVIGEFKNIKVEIMKSAIQLITHNDNPYIKK